MRTTTIFAETHTSERANHVAYRLVSLMTLSHIPRFYKLISFLKSFWTRKWATSHYERCCCSCFLSDCENP